jgi:hypothetical protein
LPISTFDAINPAFQHAKQQLFQPFRFGQWLRLAFVGLLAGEMSSGGGCNSSFKLPSTHHDQGTEQLLSGSGNLRFPDFPQISFEMVALMFCVGLILMVLMIYIASIMRFILFDSIVAKECHVREGWKRRKDNGYDLFVWQIGLALVSLVAFAVLIGIPLGAAWVLGLFHNAREHIFALVLGGITLFLLLLALGVTFAVIHVLTKDFVVPQMAIENITATAGWSRLWQQLKAGKGDYAGYVVTKTVLAIGAGICFGIITIIVILMLVIPVGGVGALAVIAGKAAGLTWDFYTISLAVVVGCVVFALLLFVISFLNVPVTVFFPAYSIYYYADRYPLLATLIHPQPVAPVDTEAPQSIPPPLPPTTPPFV